MLLRDREGPEAMEIAVFAQDESAAVFDREDGPYLGDPDLIDLYYHNGWTLILWDHSDMGEGLYLDAGNWFDAVKEVIDKLGLINEVEKIHWDFTE